MLFTLISRKAAIFGKAALAQSFSCASGLCYAVHVILRRAYAAVKSHGGESFNSKLIFVSVNKMIIIAVI